MPNTTWTGGKNILVAMIDIRMHDKKKAIVQ
jgi:hypothetical protein